MTFLTAFGAFPVPLGALVPEIIKATIMKIINLK